MERNVYTWHIAVEDGLNRGNYTYDAEQIPVGEFEAVLDFIIWSKKVMGINCYFTEKNAEKKFQLTVYRQRDSMDYLIMDGGIDFTIIPVNCLYILRVAQNAKERIVFEDAAIKVY